MKSIIRVEHPFDNKGIWRAKDEDGEYRIDSLSTYNNFSNRHSKFQPPQSDMGISRCPIQNEEFCAFKSIDSLQIWITPSELKEVVSMGFKVLLLDVSECVEGEYQILYRKDKVIQTKDISNLFI